MLFTSSTLSTYADWDKRVKSTKKWTNLDKSWQTLTKGDKLETKVDKPRQKWTNLDKPGQTWTNHDKPRQTWTNHDKPGQTWTNLDNKTTRRWWCLLVNFLPLRKFFDTIRASPMYITAIKLCLLLVRYWKRRKWLQYKCSKWKIGYFYWWLFISVWWFDGLAFKYKARNMLRWQRIRCWYQVAFFFWQEISIRLAHRIQDLSPTWRLW